MVKISVYNLKQAEKENGEWNKDKSHTQRPGMKVYDEHAENHNNNFEVSGSYYEIDEKLNEAYQKVANPKKKKSKKTKED